MSKPFHFKKFSVLQDHFPDMDAVGTVWNCEIFTVEKPKQY